MTNYKDKYGEQIKRGDTLVDADGDLCKVVDANGTMACTYFEGCYNMLLREIASSSFIQKEA